ncbi:MAG TPA: PDZ domain-containing protein [Gemmatimonadaceae bacterium]|nr:PDZ domain-containing protein [Gemmatimonadaceae bacterium]
MRTRFLIAALAAALFPAVAPAQSTRLLHQPDVSAQYVAFAYAGDIWLAPRSGGDARRVTSSPTVESDPHFSPDGKWLAFTGEYGGNPDVYVVSVEGGTPRRLTYHPGADLVRGWTPDGQDVVFESQRTGMPDGEPQLWTVPLTGGLPTRLPVPRALYGAVSPDGSDLAYQLDRPWEVEMQRYRGGQNQPIRVMDLKTYAMYKLPWTDSRDQQPVWLGNTIYFISDRDWINNLWSYDTKTKALKQITHYRDYEVESVNAGAGVVAYEQAGDVHVYDPKTGQDRTLDIHVTGDFPWAMPHAADISKALTAPQLSPTGVRALFEARGDVITVPTDKGTWRNLTHSSGIADRTPIWSPDGKQIAWFSDSTGEYELMVGDQDGLTTPRAYKLQQPTYFYAPEWSPDGKKILFTDAETNLWVLDLATGQETRVDQDNYTWPDRDLSPSWSPDSRWIAYTKRLLGSQYHAAFVYDLADHTAHQVTSGMSDVIDPVWDRSGKYLLFLASTDFALRSGWLDMSSYNQPMERGVYLAVLSKADPSPLLPETGDEPAATGHPAKPDSNGAKVEAPEVHIDFDGLSQRILSLDVPSRDYANLRTGAAGEFYYIEHVPNRADVLHRYDLKERKAIDLVNAAAEEYALSFDGKKLLYQGATPMGMPDGRWAVVDAIGPAPAPAKGLLATSDLKVTVNPIVEWRQIFDEAWRIERDYLYVANLNGADWPAIKKKYEVFLPYVRHRADLTTLLSQMQGELTVGHSFAGGGDLPKADALPAGLLGADYEVANGRYRIAKIYRGENWNPSLRAPLSAPGVDVHAGDYILSVNGVDLLPSEDIYEAFLGTVGKQVQLRVNSRPVMEGSHVVTVVPIASEMTLRERDWIEGNRRTVDSLSHGELAYVYIPDTGEGGYTNFNRYYFAQQNKKGAVIDERFNHGGSIADYMIDIMTRQLHGYFSQRLGDRYTAVTAPAAAIWGPKVLIINEMSGSGGDMFPYMFREMHVGPLIGTKTWGGLVGWGGEPRFVDGGFISAPSTGFYNPDGQWDVENKGVPPDIQVEQTPAARNAGHDPQLERAVEEAMKLLKEHPVNLKPVPPGPDRMHPKGDGGR